VKAIHQNGCPKVINIDQCGANKEAIRTYYKRCLKRILARQCKYLNNRVEADLRFIKWRTQQMLGFKSFESTSRTWTGIEILRMIKKEQVVAPMATTYKKFCSLAAYVIFLTGNFWLYFHRCDTTGFCTFQYLILLLRHTLLYIAVSSGYRLHFPVEPLLCLLASYLLH
jgi:hypothetical protein